MPVTLAEIRADAAPGTFGNTASIVTMSRQRFESIMALCEAGETEHAMLAAELVEVLFGVLGDCPFDKALEGLV